MRKIAEEGKQKVYFFYLFIYYCYCLIAAVFFQTEKRYEQVERIYAETVSEYFLPIRESFLLSRKRKYYGTSEREPLHPAI